MDYTIIAPIIKDTIQDVLSQRVYPFGFAKVRGIGNKVASGRLKNSVRVDVVPSQDRPIIRIFMEDYWQWVQSGRMPGKKSVPLDAIEEWIRSRGLTGRDKKGRFMKRKSFAFAIQTNIKKFGIRPTNFIEISLDTLVENKEFIEKIEQITVEEIIDIIEGI